MQKNQKLSAHQHVRERTHLEFLNNSAAIAEPERSAAYENTSTASLERSQTTNASRTKYLVYVSFQDDDAISIFRMDPSTGQLSWQQSVSVAGGPAPLATDHRNNFLYVGKRNTHELSSFRIDRLSGNLTSVGTVPLQGEPIQLITDRTGRFVLSAYFYQSTAAVHAVNGDGMITFPPVEWLYTAKGAHAIYTDRSNRFVFVPHVANRGGPNAIFQFTFDENTGRLTPNAVPHLSLEKYLGPRHLCFHPTLDVVYSSDEQGSSVTGYYLDTTVGTLTSFQTISTVPDTYTEKHPYSCSQIQISPSGRFLFIPTRGHNSVASFAIDRSTGKLTATGRVFTEPTPRAFSLDPSGRFLLVAGRESGRLAAYQVNQDNGELVPLETYDGGNTPMWVLITTLPEQDD